MRGDIDEELETMKARGILRSVKPKSWWDREDSLAMSVWALLLVLVVLIAEVLERATTYFLGGGDNVSSWAILAMAAAIAPFFRRMVARCEFLRDAVRSGQASERALGQLQLALGWWLDGWRPLWLLFSVILLAIGVGEFARMLFGPFGSPAFDALIETVLQLGVVAVAVPIFFFLAARRLKRPKAAKTETGTGG